MKSTSGPRRDLGSNLPTSLYHSQVLLIWIPKPNIQNTHPPIPHNQATSLYLAPHRWVKRLHSSNLFCVGELTLPILQVAKDLITSHFWQVWQGVLTPEKWWFQVACKPLFPHKKNPRKIHTDLNRCNIAITGEKPSWPLPRRAAVSKKRWNIVP